jgi:hypothetical protein
VLYDAKFLGMAAVDIWDRKNKQKAGFRYNFPGRRFSLPDSLKNPRSVSRRDKQNFTSLLI